MQRLHICNLRLLKLSLRFYFAKLLDAYVQNYYLGIG